MTLKMALGGLLMSACSQNSSGQIRGPEDTGPVAVGRDADSGETPRDAATPGGGQRLFTLSFEAQGCAAENAGFTGRTNGNCDDSARATDGQQSASLNFTEGRNMIASQGAFNISSGTVWLSYDLYADRQPNFTIMMDAWRRGSVGGDPDNPWDNRNPFSIEWRDGWFAMNCSYPNDHDTIRRSAEVVSDAGIGAWVNIVVRYDLDTELGAFWIRRLDAQGRPDQTIDPGDPAGRVNCSHYGDRGAFVGLALTDFQDPSPPAVTVYTDRWIVATDPSELP